MEKIKTFLTGNRMKSLYWRTGMMVLAVIVSSLASSIDIFSEIFSPATIVFLGLILGEISKAINKTLQARE